MTKRQKKEEQKQEPATFDSDDYYKILGVTLMCTDKEIKDAYTKLALKWHPQQPGGDEETFKKISQAFQVLGDSETRRIYNMFNKQSLQTYQQPRVTFQDANNLFRNVFGDSSISLFRQPFRPFFHDFYREFERPFESRMYQQSQDQGQIIESKTVRSVTEIRDGQRVTTTETTLLDCDGKKTTETRTEKAVMSGSIQGDPRIEEVKSPLPKGKKQQIKK